VTHCGRWWGRETDTSLVGRSVAVLAERPSEAALPSIWLAPSAVSACGRWLVVGEKPLHRQHIWGKSITCTHVSVADVAAAHSLRPPPRVS
jgi:hypothetical protein